MGRGSASRQRDDWPTARGAPILRAVAPAPGRPLGPRTPKPVPDSLAHALLARYARVVRAPGLLSVSRAHIDSCLYHGPASLDFARTLAEAGAQVTVPTTLNVGAIDLLHPELFRGDPAVAAAGRAMRQHYTAMGCRPTWTCAPYQLPDRPGLGEQVAWAESNAIVFANSALGARTERYGDFIDLCAAITGQVPAVGLHTDAGRRGRVLVEVRGVGDRARRHDTFFAVLGHVVGRAVGTAIPVIDGVDAASEDDLKAFGAAAASSGAVAMFHMVGITPEAPTRAAAFGGDAPARTLVVGPAELAAGAAELTSTGSRQLGAVSLGTPHFSYDEFTRLRALLAGRAVSPAIECYVSTGRDVLARLDAEGWGDALRAQGVRMVTDTCTYLSPILRGAPGVVMTNSAKWAWYAPGNLGYQVVFGSLAECVESAVRGAAWRDESPWGAPAGGPRAVLAEGGDTLAAVAQARALVAGEGEGPVLALDERLSFWGGVDAETGAIIDTHHPQHGASVAGTVVVLPTGRGSSSSSSVLAEVIRGGVGPAALVLREGDPILALGALVAEALYGRAVPVVELPPADYAAVAARGRARVVAREDGVTVT